MYNVLLRIKVPRNRRKDFLDAARLVTGPCRIQPGCISCHFYQDLDDPDTTILVQEWKSWENFNDHVRSDEYRIILSLMELADEAPEIKLNTIAKTEGLEAIEALRSEDYRL